MSLFSQIGTAIGGMSDSLSRARQLRDLEFVSDAALKAKGTSRDQMVRRILLG